MMEKRQKGSVSPTERGKVYPLSLLPPAEKGQRRQKGAEGEKGYCCRRGARLPCGQTVRACARSCAAGAAVRPATSAGTTAAPLNRNNRKNLSAGKSTFTAPAGCNFTCPLPLHGAKAKRKKAAPKGGFSLLCLRKLSCCCSPDQPASCSIRTYPWLPLPHG